MGVISTVIGSIYFLFVQFISKIAQEVVCGWMVSRARPNIMNFWSCFRPDPEAGILKEKFNIFLSLLSSFEMKYLLLTQIWFWIEGVERLSSLGGGMCLLLFVEQLLKLMEKLRTWVCGSVRTQSCSGLFRKREQAIIGRMFYFLCVTGSKLSSGRILNGL